MNKYPVLSDEIDIKKIEFSDINYNDNRQFCYISYGKSNESLYLQTPLFRFIQPISSQKIGAKEYNEIYLFLTPHDQSTFKFIEIINNIETKCIDHIYESTEQNLMLTPVIKTSDIESNNESINENTNKTKQVIKYMRIKLLDQTKFEYNKKQITFNELNELVSKVNLKVIFEINMFWLTQNKIGLFLKPLRIKAIDIVNNPIINFREDDNLIQNDVLQTEVDNIKTILNNQSISTLNDSVFNTNPINKTQGNNLSVSKNYGLVGVINTNGTQEHVMNASEQRELVGVSNTNVTREISNTKPISSHKSKQVTNSSEKKLIGVSNTNGTQNIDDPPPYNLVHKTENSKKNSVIKPSILKQGENNNSALKTFIPSNGIEHDSNNMNIDQQLNDMLFELKNKQNSKHKSKNSLKHENSEKSIKSENHENSEKSEISEKISSSIEDIDCTRKKKNKNKNKNKKTLKKKDNSDDTS